jgi:SAM-dependent methyltransferase
MEVLMEKEVEEIPQEQNNSIDIAKDIAVPTKFPWNYESGSVDSVTCIGVLEYIGGENRAAFFDEIYRVLRPGAKATVIVPYWNTAMGIQDLRYKWPPLAEQSFQFFNKKIREENKLNEGPFKIEMNCDFEMDFGYTASLDIASREVSTRDYMIKHYANSIIALQVTLTKK